ncbi:MAG: hypothetical protein AB7D57_00770 [Desulfovibrionaceae bacterium]
MHSQLDCKTGVRRTIIRPFLPTDALEIALDPDGPDARDLAGADMAALGRYFAWGGAWGAEGGLARTVERLEPDGRARVVGAGGVVAIPGTRTGDAWILPSALVPMYPLAVHRLARTVLAEAEARGLTRIQTLILVGHERARRFIRRLGFRCEGLLRRCGHNGLDRFIYARISEGA